MCITKFIYWVILFVNVYMFGVWVVYYSCITLSYKKHILRSGNDYSLQSETIDVVKTNNDL